MVDEIKEEIFVITRKGIQISLKYYDEKKGQLFVKSVGAAEDMIVELLYLLDPDIRDIKVIYNFDEGLN